MDNICRNAFIIFMMSIYSIVIMVTFNGRVDYTEMYIGIPTVALLLFAFLSARDAAKAAWEAVVTAKDDQRPWLQVEPKIRGNLKLDEENSMLKIRFNISIKNVGRSPAENVTVRYFSKALGHWELFDINGFCFEGNTPPELRMCNYSISPGQRVDSFVIFNEDWASVEEAARCSRLLYEQYGHSLVEGNYRAVLIVFVYYDYLINRKERWVHKAAFSIYQDRIDGSLPPLNVEMKDIESKELYINTERSENVRIYE